MARVLCASGARATEELLLKELDEDQARVAADPSLLRRPLRVVVPSRSLRDHVAARVCAHRGAAAGVVIQTHLQLAYAVLRAEGLRIPPTQDALLDLLIRRHAREQPELEQALGALQLGYRAVTASAGDLLHAALEPAQREALLEAVATLGEGVRARRTRGVVRATLEALEEFSERGLSTRDDLLRLAAEKVLGNEVELLGRALIVHGYADATGIVTAFLERLLTHSQAVLLLDRPRDPAHPEREDLGVEFSRPFGLRLGETKRSVTGHEVPPPQLARFSAPGSRAEAREIARRIRRRLDRPDAPAPETIAVVTRSLGSRLHDLAEAFDEYGVPWQAPGAVGSVDPCGRRLLAFRELLLRGAQCPLPRWFEARGEESSAWPSRLALSVLGVARLGQLRELDERGPLRGRDSLKLPHRVGFVRADDATPGAARPDPLRVSAEEIRRCKESARALLARIESMSTLRSFGAHAELTLEIAREDLAWEDGEALERWRGVLSSVPPGFEMQREEFLALLHEAVERAARPESNGLGGGVRVLDLTQARALSFAHIYVLGLNRGDFPPAPREDPLLPDAVRARLRAVLPELRSKLDRSREERFLFAQLLSAAPDLTLSWWTADDDGRATPPSPYVQRLRLDQGGEMPSAPAPLEIEGRTDFARPLREHLLQAALNRDAAGLETLLAAALGDGDAEAPTAGDPPALARTALRVLHEYDLAPSRAPDLGPWMGSLPPVQSQLADPRAAEAHVTSLEDLAACPWAWVLQRLLGVEAIPDPLESLPSLDRRRVGMVVHRALETLFRSGAGSDPVRRLSRLEGPASRVEWPREEELHEISVGAATQVLHEEGLALPGLARALARRAQLYLDECRRMLFAPDAPQVLGAEVHGAAQVELPEGGTLRVPFRADLVDRSGGILRLLDFKTGKSFVSAVREDTRQEHLTRALASGRHLQGMVYALAAERAEAPGIGIGAYLFLDPNEDERRRRLELTSDDAEHRAILSEILSLLHRLAQHGWVFPRLVDAASGNEPTRCAYCEVATACVRGDTQNRQRQEEWFQRLGARRDAGESLHAMDEALLAVWELPGRKS